MPRKQLFNILRAVTLLAYLLVCKATISILLTYRDYFPPNFQADFLLGRNTYFFGTYRWAFYTHIIAGPFTLIAGLMLISNSIRRRFTRLHRILGRFQIACILLLLTPSGLWMARYAATGTIAASGFATLAVVTASCAALGWRAAVRRRFVQHRSWMLRCFILLCSAIVLRLIGGLSEPLGAEWTYPAAAWVSWLIPLLILESVNLPFRLGRPSSWQGDLPALDQVGGIVCERQEMRQG